MLNIMIPILLMVVSVFIIQFSLQKETVIGMVGGIFIFIVSMAYLGDELTKNKKPSNDSKTTIIEKHEVAITAEEYRIILQLVKKDFPK